MTDLYTKFAALSVKSEYIGFLLRDDNTPYFCTPEGAEILGWAGTDGIHFCRLRDFGDRVFSVSPMEADGAYVHLLADNFTDFLRLLLSCGDTAALEQAHLWNREQFDTFLQENPLMEEQQKALRCIQEQLRLLPMEDPYAYLSARQAEWERLSALASKDEAAALPAKPEWKVYFSGSLWGQCEKGERAGQEVSLNEGFHWGRYDWLIPAAYRCGKGVVLDLCRRIAPEEILAFQQKWKLTPESVDTDFTPEQQMELQAENPLQMSVDLSLWINGRELRSSEGSGVCWDPVFPESCDEKVRELISHYQLDPIYGWEIMRAAFPWSENRGPRKIRSVDLELRQETMPHPGPHFIGEAGSSISLVHPVSGVCHTLTVEGVKPLELPETAFQSRNLEYPRHGAILTYSVTPELSDRELRVIDCREGDHPRQRAVEISTQPEEVGAACIGVIGGADGPVSIFVGGSAEEEEPKLHQTCSSLYFTPPQRLEWKAVWYRKELADQRVPLDWKDT